MNYALQALDQNPKGIRDRLYGCIDDAKRLEPNRLPIGMTFAEAVARIKAHPAGPGAIAVARASDNFQFLFAAPPTGKMQQMTIMGGWTAKGRKSETHHAVISVEDIEANDWEVIEL